MYVKGVELGSSKPECPKPHGMEKDPEKEVQVGVRGDRRRGKSPRQPAMMLLLGGSAKADLFRRDHEMISAHILACTNRFQQRRDSPRQPEPADRPRC